LNGFGDDRVQACVIADAEVIFDGSSWEGQ
jgi:hypothetical protein